MPDSNEDWSEFNPRPPGSAPQVAPGASGAAAVPQAQDEFAEFNPKPPPQAVYRGSILPFTRYSDESVKFEPMASGPIGSILGFGKGFAESALQAATLPKRALTGEAQMPPLGFPPDDPRSQAMAAEGLNFASVFGPNINPMVRSGDLAVPGVARRAPDMSLATVPSSAELKRVGGEQLENTRALPAIYDPQHLPTLADKIEQDLIKDGIFPEDAKGLYASLNRMRASQPPPGSTIHFEPANLMSLRKNIANKFESPEENKHGLSIALRHIDDFIENPPAQAVLGGPASQAAAAQLSDLYAKGRANFAAGARGEDLADIRRTADFRAASANSGQNLDNALRSRVTSAILNANKMKGFTPEEVAQLEAIPLGTTPNNILRWTGNTLGGGGGLGSVVTGGLAGMAASFLGAGPGTSATIAATVPALGKYLKGRAGVGTAEALTAAEKATRRRSPLFLEQAGNQDLVSGSPWRDALTRVIMNRAAQPPAQLDPPPGVRPEDYL